MPDETVARHTDDARREGLTSRCQRAYAGHMNDDTQNTITKFARRGGLG